MPADSSPSWIWCEALATRGQVMVLAEPESHYLTRVVRVRVGQRVTITDGLGGVAQARVASLQRSGVEVEIENHERRTRAREAWVLCGAPQGLRADWLVEKLEEIGVAVLQPVEFERASWSLKSSRVERWRRLATAALRQSRRAFLMEIRPARPLREVLADLPAESARWLADPEGPIASTRTSKEELSVGLIGPAEGITPRERDHLVGTEFQPISLSDGRLRTETAAMAWATWWGFGSSSGGVGNSLS